MSSTLSGRDCTLAKIKLRTSPDVVTLRRRIRGISEQLGLPPRHAGGLSAAAYEVAQALSEYRGVDVDIRVTDGSSLEIVFRLPLSDAGERREARTLLSARITALRGVVHEIELEEHRSRLLVRLRAPFPIDANPVQSAPLKAEPTASSPEDAALSIRELRHRYAKLRRAYRELSEELQETNRGVVALHAELERDIAKRQQLEDDLRQQAEELASANRAKEEFLATLSHELRTPLNAMLGWARLLRMGKLEGSAMSRALETIERNAHIQEQLISDILDVSRIVTGKLRLELKPLELAPVVTAALDAIRPAAEAKGIQLTSTMAFDGLVLGDADRLQQVIWNLVVNAIKFTPRGGRISVSVDQPATSAVVTVSDTGEGIAPDLLPYIFDRFTQGDTSVTRLHGGLGLGLAIVRHIVELHGGKVHASSDGAGRGATFSVHLPVRTVQQAGEQVDVNVQPRSVVSLFVVEDDAARPHRAKRRTR